MALPVEISDFFVEILSFWFALPLFLRQVFYLFFAIRVILFAMNMTIGVDPGD